MRSHFGILIYLPLDRLFAFAVDAKKAVIQPWMVETYLLVNTNRIGVALDIAKPILPVEAICHFCRALGAVLMETLSFRLFQQPVAKQQQKRPADSKYHTDQVKSDDRSQSDE